MTTPKSFRSTVYERNENGHPISRKIAIPFVGTFLVNEPVFLRIRERIIGRKWDRQSFINAIYGFRTARR
jgi:hypothetical protein